MIQHAQIEVNGSPVDSADRRGVVVVLPAASWTVKMGLAATIADALGCQPQSTYTDGTGTTSLVFNHVSGLHDREEV